MLEKIIATNRVNVLFAIGNFDILYPKSHVDDIKRDLHALSQGLREMGNIKVRFLDLPFLPAISKFPNDVYEIEKDRTREIMDLNVYFMTLNQGDARVPFTHYEGISNEEFNQDGYPENNVHRGEGWVGPLNDAVRFSLASKLNIWEEILAYFLEA